MSPEYSLREKETFYNALSENQKNKVEEKVKRMLRESYESLPNESVSPIRHQVAFDMFKILQD